MTDKTQGKNVFVRSFLALTEWLFPNFDEIHYIMLLWLAGCLIVSSGTTIEALDFFLTTIEGFALFAVAAGIGILLLLRRKPAAELIYLTCLMYYSAFAFLATIALDEQTVQGAPEGVLAMINYWFIYVILYLTAARILLFIFLYRLGVKSVNKLLDQNFHPIQYRPLAFIVACSMVTITYLSLSSFEYSSVTICLLSYSYANIAFFLFKNLSRYLRIPIFY